jgi:CheY-like chemotaxis protein
MEQGPGERAQKSAGKDRETEKESADRAKAGVGQRPARPVREQDRIKEIRHHDDISFREKWMTGILLIGLEDSTSDDFRSGLKRYDGITLRQADTGREALGMILKETIDLVVTDEEIPDMTGLEFARELVSVNPMTNCAVVSSLSPEDFHEVSEGLGVLMQLPGEPDGYHATMLVDCLFKVLGLA